jgi:Yip1 domain
MKLVDRVKAIMFTPRTEWPVIAKESGGMTGLYVGYVAILAAIPEVANLIGQSLIGAYTPIAAGLLRAIIVYAAAFAVVYFVALVIDLLARRFGGKKNWPNAFKLSVYSHTPLWLAGIFLIVPGLNFLVILGGLLGFYLLRVGLPLLMGARDDKALVYAMVVTACALIPTIVRSII